MNYFSKVLSICLYLISPPLFMNFLHLGKNCCCLKGFLAVMLNVEEAEGDYPQSF